MRTAPRIGSGLVGWRRLAVVAALANAAVLLGYGLTRDDREALGCAVVMLVGVGLLRVGRGLVGLLVLAALFVNIEFWMFPAANGNATYRVGVVELLIPASLVAFSLAGLIGAVAAAVQLRDPDLFWHTFTIDALGVEVRSPVGRLRTATFEARPGRYAFYCAIPGHASLGMRGTLTV